MAEPSTQTLQPARLPPQSAAVLGFVTEHLVSQLEQKVELVKRYRLVLLKLTTEEHWIDQSGKPHLESDGVHALAACLGVVFEAPVFETEEHRESTPPWVAYHVTVTARLGDRTISEIGSASSKDDFLASAGKGKGLLPLEQVDLGNIRKKALTNAQSRAFTKLSGLGSTTWAELAQVGIRPSRSVDYRGRGESRGAAQGAGTWNQEREELWKKLCEMCGGADAAAQALEDMTANPDRQYKGIRDLKSASDRQLAYLKGRILAEWDKFQAGPDGPAEKREPGAEG